MGQHLRFRCVVLALALIAPAHAQHCGPAGWEEQTLTYRQGHAMAFDAARGRLVIFGGGSVAGENALEGSLRDETWEWEPTDGAGAGRWILRTRGGPSPRRSCSMAYDAARQRMVLFGGTEFNKPLADTWEWDGVIGQWSLVTTTGPAPRSATAMTYDSLRQRVLLFTGTLYSGPGELWAFDGAEGAWSLLSTSGPNARGGAGLAYDAARDRVVLYGGYGGSGFPYNEDTWEWDGTAWTQRVVVSPPGIRAGVQLAYDVARQRTVLFGGTGGASNYPTDTWEWDGSQWERRATGGINNRTDHRMAYDPVRERVVLFGGWIPFGDSHRIWEWTGAEWVRRPATDPQPRHESAMAYDPARDRAVLFGGGSYEETWEWSPADKRWTLVADAGLSSRSGHDMVFDVLRGRTLLFGGRVAAVPLRSNETWEWNGKLWQQVKAIGPSARDSHAMVYDTRRNRAILFGGQVLDGITNAETWIYESAGMSWGQLPIAGPPGRFRAGMAYDPSRDVVILHGGTGSFPSGSRSDTWELAFDDAGGGAWRQVAAAQGPFRSGHRLAFDHVRQRVTLFGGVDSESNRLNDMWELAPDANADHRWRLLAHTPILGRTVFANAYDTLRREWIVFGGAQRLTGIVLPDTWKWNPTGAVSITVEPRPFFQSIRRGAAIEFSMRAIGSLPIQFQWRRDDEPLEDDERIIGARTELLRIQDIRRHDAGTYHAIATNECGEARTREITITVCDPDLNADGVVNTQDYFDFLRLFFDNDPEADLNADAIVNASDFYRYLQWFFGCP